MRVQRRSRADPRQIPSPACTERPKPFVQESGPSSSSGEARLRLDGRVRPAPAGDALLSWSSPALASAKSSRTSPRYSHDNSYQRQDPAVRGKDLEVLQPSLHLLL